MNEFDKVVAAIGVRVGAALKMQKEEYDTALVAQAAQLDALRKEMQDRINIEEATRIKVLGECVAKFSLDIIELVKDHARIDDVKKYVQEQITAIPAPFMPVIDFQPLEEKIATSYTELRARTDAMDKRIDNVATDITSLVKPEQLKTAMESQTDMLMVVDKQVVELRNDHAVTKEYLEGAEAGHTARTANLMARVQVAIDASEKGCTVEQATDIATTAARVVQEHLDTRIAAIPPQHDYYPQISLVRTDLGKDLSALRDDLLTLRKDAAMHENFLVVRDDIETMRNASFRTTEMFVKIGEQKADVAETIELITNLQDNKADNLALTELDTKVRVLLKRLDDLPVPKDGKDADITPLEVEFEALRKDIENQAKVNTLAVDLLRQHIISLPVPVKGQDGRDAKFSEPVTYEDNKFYIYGTVARHAGGLWYAARDTDKEPGADGHGWILIVEGIAGVAVTQNDTHVILEIKRTSGSVSRIEHRVHRIKFRGTYAAEEKYLEGDAVQHQGSTWYSRVDNPDTSPGTTEGADQWTLGAKRGRSGRNPVVDSRNADGSIRLGDQA